VPAGQLLVQSEPERYSPDEARHELQVVVEPVAHVAQGDVHGTHTWEIEVVPAGHPLLQTLS